MGFPTELKWNLSYYHCWPPRGDRQAPPAKDETRPAGSPENPECVVSPLQQPGRHIVKAEINVTTGQLLAESVFSHFLLASLTLLDSHIDDEVAEFVNLYFIAGIEQDRRAQFFDHGWTVDSITNLQSVAQQNWAK